MDTSSYRNQEAGADFALFSTTKEAWDAMYLALEAAKNSILWEIYIFADDPAGHRFVELLKNKAASGLEVRLIVDRIGSRFLSSKTLEELRRSGVEILFYNPVYFEVRFNRWFMRLWNRNHRKVLIIDEEIAFIGGVNITFAATDWDDLHLKLAGRSLITPLVLDFAATYRVSKKQRQFGRFVRVAKEERPKRWSAGDIFFVSLAPHPGSDRIFLRNFYLKAIGSARQKITLFTPYYVPYKKFLAAIVKARKRGVEVEIIVPLRTDHRFVDYMSYYFLQLSERLGATIYLLPRMNHAKGFVIDNITGLIGSSNFTHRSFSANAESDVFFKNPALVAHLQKIITQWKECSAPVGEIAQKKRPLRAGFLNWVAQLFKEYV